MDIDKTSGFDAGAGEKLLDALFFEMMRHEAGCPHRAQHLTKVHAFARRIARAEGLDPRTTFVLEAAALAHDIGIRPALAKYGRDDGPYQEKEGAPLARALLARLGFDEAAAERVAWLVGHHHTYAGIDGMDYQILVEADFLVNWHENGTDAARIAQGLGRIFRTPTGIALARTMFGLTDGAPGPDAP